LQKNQGRAAKPDQKYETDIPGKFHKQLPNYPWQVSDSNDSYPTLSDT
jgi:hypothetical protein